MTTEVSNATTTTTTGSSSASSQSSLTSDFDTFVKLLTAQAQYQDPLEPLDGTEYASQLAEFSMVEQQVLTNDNLSVVHEQLNLGNMAALTGWVGMEVRAAASVPFDGTNPISISPNPVATADEVTLIVRDENGDEVTRLPLPVSAEEYQWNGTDADGDPVETGVYSFLVESSRDGEVLLTETAEVYTDVRETQLVNGSVVLITETGTAILATSVTALRDPNTGETTETETT